MLLAITLVAMARWPAAAAAAAPAELFVDYTASTLRLPAGITAGVAAAVQARLSAVRQRAAAPTLLALHVALAAAGGSDGDRTATTATVGVEWGVPAATATGSYRLVSDGVEAVLTVRDGDEQGLLNGLGRLLRELRIDRRTATARLPRRLRCEHNEAEALWLLRGHQVSTAHYPSSLKTWPAFREYVADLAVFGTNQIELAHTAGQLPNPCSRSNAPTQPNSTSIPYIQQRGCSARLQYLSLVYVLARTHGGSWVFFRVVACTGQLLPCAERGRRAQYLTMEPMRATGRWGLLRRHAAGGLAAARGQVDDPRGGCHPRHVRAEAAAAPPARDGVGGSGGTQRVRSSHLLRQSPLYFCCRHRTCCAPASFVSLTIDRVTSCRV